MTVFLKHLFFWTFLPSAAMWIYMKITFSFCVGFFFVLSCINHIPHFWGTYCTHFSGERTVTDSSLTDFHSLGEQWSWFVFILFICWFAWCRHNTDLFHLISEAADISIHQAADSSTVYILWALLSLPTQCFAAARQGSRTNVVMSWPTPAITSVRMRGCAH